MSLYLGLFRMHTSTTAAVRRRHNAARQCAECPVNLINRTHKGLTYA